MNDKTTKSYEGIILPMLTPFGEEENTSKNRMRKLVDFLIDDEVPGTTNIELSFTVGVYEEYRRGKIEEV